MPTPPLGKLEKIELKSAWLSEPGDFTPWLAEEANLAQLAESLGIDELELEATEERRAVPSRHPLQGYKEWPLGPHREPAQQD